MQNRALAIVVLLSLGAFAAGTLIAPSNKEVALMHMRDADFDEALKLYQGLENKGDDSIAVIVPLVNLYTHYGDTDKAIAVLQVYTDKHPHSVDARQRLAELYKASQRLHDYCRELEELEALSPTAKDLRKLANTYDLLGFYPQEAHALQRLIEIKGYTPQEEDYVKLAILDRVAGKFDDATKTLTQGIELKKYEVNVDTIHVAIQLMLEQHQNDTAFAAAKNYMHKSAKEADAIVLSSLFQNFSRLENAYEILAPYLGNIDKSLDLEMQVVSVMLAQKRESEVYELLNRQFTHNILPISLTETFLDLAVKHRDFQLVEHIIQNTDLEKISSTALLNYADFAFQTKNPGIAQLMRKKLGASYLAQSPLLASVLNITADYSPKTMADLLNLPQTDMTLPEEKLIVSSIFVRYGYADRARLLFEHIPAGSILEILDPVQFSTLYLDANQTQSGEEKLKEAEHAGGSTGDSVSKSLFFLFVGEGKTADVQAWLKAHPANDPDLMDDAYYLAVRYHRDALALELAQQIYRTNQTPKNLRQLTDAFLLNHHYAEAVRILRKTSDHSGTQRQAMLDAVSSWIDYEGKTHTGQNLDYLSTSVSELSNLNLSANEKHNLAYLLEASGFHDLAEGYFVDLASTQPFNSPDVQELLGFWNDQLSQPALDWMITRARNASPDERVQWLSYLKDANYGDRVVDFLKADEHLSGPLMDLYIDALVDTHKTDDLQHVLQQAIDNEDNADRLEHFAKVAENQNLQTIAEKAWQNIYDIEPNNAQAAKWLGLRAYDQRRYAEAGRLLKQYLHEDNEDYRANFAYGDIVSRQPGKKNEALPYYKLALSQLSEIKDPSPDILEDKARLLYLNNQQKQALELLRKLFAEYPENKSIRADLVETLMQLGQFKDAAALLPQ